MGAGLDQSRQIRKAAHLHTSRHAWIKRRQPPCMRPAHRNAQCGDALFVDTRMGNQEVDTCSQFGQHTPKQRFALPQKGLGRCVLFHRRARPETGHLQTKHRRAKISQIAGIGGLKRRSTLHKLATTDVIGRTMGVTIEHRWCWARIIRRVDKGRGNALALRKCERDVLDPTSANWRHVGSVGHVQK